MAVGKNASKLMKRLGIAVVHDVRHPANGGAGQFSSELKTVALLGCSRRLNN